MCVGGRGGGPKVNEGHQILSAYFWVMKQPKLSEELAQPEFFFVGWTMDIPMFDFVSVSCQAFFQGNRILVARLQNGRCLCMDAILNNPFSCAPSTLDFARLSKWECLS